MCKCYSDHLVSKAVTDTLANLAIWSIRVASKSDQGIAVLYMAMNETVINIE
jgi:hypothetical protein